MLRRLLVLERYGSEEPPPMLRAGRYLKHSSVMSRAT